MAQNPYVNKVLYGNQTVMDISGDTVTPADVASGKTFHDASGAAQTGSYVAPTITPITPYNSVPAEMLANTGYRPTTNGYAIKDYSYVYPSNAHPRSVQRDDVCVIESAGLFIDSIVNVAPSDTTPPSVSSGEIVRMGGAGYLYASQQTTTSVTPSDSNPPLLTANTKYTPTANGYLYETQQTGGTLTPTLAYTSKSNPNNPKTYTYDATKRYIIISAYLVSTALGGANRTSVWYLDKGTLSERMGASQTDGASTVTNDTSTHKLTMTGTNASYRTEFTVIRLD